MSDIHMTDADWAIIEVLEDGRNNAPNISRETGYTRQYITERLKRMEEHGIVVNIGAGIYELESDKVQNR